MSTVKQVSDDTFELVSKQSHDVVDYGYIIEAYRQSRGDDAFALNRSINTMGKRMTLSPLCKVVSCS